jgi:hypothetical protein
MEYLVLLQFDAGFGVMNPGEIYTGPHALELVSMGCLKPLGSLVPTALNVKEVTPEPAPSDIQASKKRKPAKGK